MLRDSSFLLTLGLVAGLSPFAQAATYTVTNLDDAGSGSLRQAIADANASPEADQITFNSGVQGIITLLSGELLLNGELSIVGPGADKLAISGGDRSRIFHVAASKAALAGLTLRGGLVVGATGRPYPGDGSGGRGEGGAIINYGTLSLTDVTLSSNLAVGGVGVRGTPPRTPRGRPGPGGPGGAGLGGAISNRETLILKNVSFFNNQARGGSGGSGGNTTPVFGYGPDGNAYGGAIYNRGTIQHAGVTSSGNKVVAVATAGAGFGNNLFTKGDKVAVVESVSLIPAAPVSGDALTANVKILGAVGDTATKAFYPKLSYTWTRTRGGITETLPSYKSNILPLGQTLAGDLITCSAVAIDDEFTSEPRSASVTIQNKPLKISALILQPKEPYTFERMVATVKVADKSGAKPLFTFVWTRNGVVTRTTSTRNSQDIYDLNQQGRGDKGDFIEVTVTATNGASVDSAKASATIRNSVPVIAALSLSPQAPTPKQFVTSTYSGRDADGDTLTKVYKWKIRNKVLVEEKGSRLDLSKYPGVKAGDVITLEMRLSDGTALSKTMQSQVTVQADTTPKSSAVTSPGVEAASSEDKPSANSS